MFPNPGAENIITQTIKGLQGTPAYLLIFAVYATAIISIFWLLQTIHDETWALPAFIVVQVVGSVLVAILFDKVVRNASADIKRHQVEAERKAAAEKQRADEAERKAAKSIPETGN